MPGAAGRRARGPVEGGGLSVARQEDPVPRQPELGRLALRCLEDRDVAATAVHHGLLAVVGDQLERHEKPRKNH